MISMDNFWNDLDDAIAATNGMETKSAKAMMSEFLDDHRGVWPHIEADIAVDAAARVDQERLAQHLLCAMGGLRQSEREVLALCDWAGLSYSEAAVAMGVPEGTVRSRLSRARQHLRDLAGEVQPRCVQLNQSPARLLAGGAR